MDLKTIELTSKQNILVIAPFAFGYTDHIVNALNTLDLPVIMGSVLVIAFMFITINILVDLIYRILDPRVKLN